MSMIFGSDLLQIAKRAAIDTPIGFLKVSLMLGHDFKHFHDAIERRDGLVENRIEQQLGVSCPLAVQRLDDQLALGWEEMVKAAFLHLGVVAQLFNPDDIVAGGKHEVDGTFDEAFARVGDEASGKRTKGALTSRGSSLIAPFSLLKWCLALIYPDVILWIQPYNAQHALRLHKKHLSFEQAAYFGSKLVAYSIILSKPLPPKVANSSPPA